MKIFLIRHGETDWNLQGRFQGIEDIDLNKNGEEQALLCGKALLGESFTAVIASPLIRARKTAEIIAEIIGVKEVGIESDLIERDFGKISGMTPEKRKEFLESQEDAGMESMGQVYERMRNCVIKYARTYPQGKVIMISHGASINALLSMLSEGEIGSGKTLLKNTCINILDIVGDSIKIDYYNISREEYLNITKKH